MAVEETLVDAFISSAQQYRARRRGELTDPVLGDSLPCGGEMNHRARKARTSLAGRRQGQSQWLGHHQHARATAVRSVVHAAVVVLGKVAQRPEFDVHLAGLERTPGNALRQMGRKKLGEQGDDIKAHIRPSATQ